MELIMTPKLKSVIIQIKSNVKSVKILSNQLGFDLKSKGVFYSLLFVKAISSSIF